MKNEQHEYGGHNHPEDSPARLAKYGNLTMGIGGAVIGVVTQSEALLADAGHNFGDYFAHSEHLNTSEAQRHQTGEHEVHKSSKRAGRIMGAIALGTALYSGFSLYQQATSDEPVQRSNLAAVAEAGSIGLNLVVKRKNKKQPPELRGQHHSNKHNNIDLYSSMAAFTGIVLNPIIPGIEGVVGVAISSVTGKFAYDLYKGKAHE